MGYAAYAASSAFFWAGTASPVARIAATLLSAPAWRQLPAALLLDPAVLPYTVLLALSLELCYYRSQFDALLFKGSLPLLLPYWQRATLPELAASGWWPLELCRACLELAVAQVGGLPGGCRQERPACWAADTSISSRFA